MNGATTNTDHRVTTCGHEQRAPLYGGLLERCCSCGLVMTAANLDFNYSERYFTTDDGSGYDFDSDFALSSDAGRFVPELERLEREGLRGSVLDIGCATGGFLSCARARGWEIAGVELSDFARKTAETRLGTPIASSLDNLPGSAVYDVVTMHHVLEHLHEPEAFLRTSVTPRTRRRVVIEVPNFNSLRSRVHGSGWEDLRPDQHVYHYDPKTLSRLVEAAGFRVTDVMTLGPAVWSLRETLAMARLLAKGLATSSAEASPKHRSAHERPSVATFRRPTGVRYALTEASRLAMLPAVRWLETRLLAERLVVEAEPRNQR